jgi:predicted nuclease of predicted toxin-antitoxin system
MKLLLDANLSWRLIEKLKFHFESCIHVDRCTLPVPAKDLEVWQFAKDNELIIVTNDDDFLNLINFKGFPPKVILLKTGNQSNEFIVSLLINHKEDITALQASEEYGLLEIY